MLGPNGSPPPLLGQQSPLTTLARVPGPRGPPRLGQDFSFHCEAQRSESNGSISQHVYGSTVPSSITGTAPQFHPATRVWLHSSIQQHVYGSTVPSSNTRTAPQFHPATRVRPHSSIQQHAYGPTVPPSNAGTAPQFHPASRVRPHSSTQQRGSGPTASGRAERMTLDQPQRCRQPLSEGHPHLPHSGPPGESHLLRRLRYTDHLAALATLTGPKVTQKKAWNKRSAHRNKRSAHRSSQYSDGQDCWCCVWARTRTAEKRGEVVGGVHACMGSRGRNTTQKEDSSAVYACASPGRRTLTGSQAGV